MKFHVEFNYESDQREKVLRLLHEGGLKSSDCLKVKGAWVALATGYGFTVIECDDARTIYELCSVWSDYGKIRVTPVIDAREL